MTTPITLETNKNIIIKVFNALADSKNSEKSLIFKSQILNLFLKDKKIYDFLINPGAKSNLSLTRNGSNNIVSNNYFLIYYLLYYKQSTILDIDTFINEVFDKKTNFFEYNILPITKQTKHDIENLGYYNGKQFIISHHPESALNFRLENAESVFFENIGNIDFTKTILDLEDFKLFLDIIYNQTQYYNSKSFINVFAESILPVFVDISESKIEKINDNNQKSADVFDEISKLTTTNLSKTIGINAKTLTLGDMVLMSPEVNPNYKSSLYGDDNTFYKSPLTPGFPSGYFFNDEYFTRVLDLNLASDDEAFRNKVLNEGALQQAGKSLNEFFMHTETLFSVYDNTENTFFNLEMSSENNFKIKKEDDEYKQEIVSFYSNSKISTKINENLVKNFETVPFFLNETFADQSNPTYAYNRNIANFDNNYQDIFSVLYRSFGSRPGAYYPSRYIHKKAEEVETLGTESEPKGVKTKVLNDFFKKKKKNNNTLSYIKSINVVNDEGEKFIQINTEFRFLSSTASFTGFDPAEFDIHCTMIPFFEIKTVLGTTPFTIYTEDTTDLDDDLVLKKISYRCSVNKILEIFTNEDAKTNLPYNNIVKLYNKKLLFNYNLHVYKSKQDLQDLGPITELELILKLEELGDSNYGAESDFKVAAKSLDAHGKMASTLFSSSKRAQRPVVPDNFSDSSSQEVTKVSIPLRVTSDTYSMTESTAIGMSNALVQDAEDTEFLTAKNLQKIKEIPLITDEDVLFNGGKRNIPAFMKNISYGKSISYQSRSNNVQPRLLNIIYRAFLDTKNKFSSVTRIVITSGGDPPMWKWAEFKIDGQHKEQGYSSKRRKTMRHDLGFAADVMIKRTILTDRGKIEVHTCLWQPHDDNDFKIFKFFIESCRKYGARGIGAGRGYMDIPEFLKEKQKVSISKRSNGMHIDIAHLNPTFETYLAKENILKQGLMNLGVSEAKLKSYPISKRIKTFSRKNDFWGEDDTSASAETWLRTIFGATKATGKFDVATIDAESFYITS